MNVRNAEVEGHPRLGLRLKLYPSEIFVGTLDVSFCLTA